MQMATKPRRWTRADLERLPDDGKKYEVVHGELLVSPAPRPAHEYIRRALAQRLARYCEVAAVGHVFAGSAAFVIDDSATIPDIVVREPAFPPPERWDDAPVPLLAVEILSDSTRRNDEIRKRGFYIESGIREYWIVDGSARTVRVVSSAGDHVETAKLTWRPVATEPALEVDLAPFFGEALDGLRAE